MRSLHNWIFLIWTPNFIKLFYLHFFSDKKINSQAALLRDYWQRVKNGEETSSTVSFVEYSNWYDFGDLFVDNDLIICIWRKSDPDISRMLLDLGTWQNQLLGVNRCLRKFASYSTHRLWSWIFKSHFLDKFQVYKKNNDTIRKTILNRTFKLK